VSFTSVVGYSSVKSDNKIKSPLFRMKINRCEVSSNYLGKGKEIKISLPIRNRGISIIQNVLDKIKIMDDKEFKSFIDLIISRVYQDNTIKDQNVDEIISALHMLKSHPNQAKNYFINVNNDLGGDSFVTVDWYTLCNWVPFCIPLVILEILIGLIYMFQLIYDFWWYYGSTVDTAYCSGCCGVETFRNG